MKLLLIIISSVFRFLSACLFIGLRPEDEVSGPAPVFAAELN